MVSIFSTASWASVCHVWRNVYLGLLPIFWLSCFSLSWYWDTWAVCKLWIWVPCQLFHLQIFSPILWVVLLLFMVSLLFKSFWVWFSSVQSLRRVWLFATPWITACHPSTVHHQLPELTQTHVHRVGDSTQPSQPLSSPSPPAPSLSQHQGLFQWVNSSHEVTKVFLLGSFKIRVTS